MIEHILKFSTELEGPRGRYLPIRNLGSPTSTSKVKTRCKKENAPIIPRLLSERPMKINLEALEKKLDTTEPGLFQRKYPPDSDGGSHRMYPWYLYAIIGQRSWHSPWPNEFRTVDYLIRGIDGMLYLSAF